MKLLTRKALLQRNAIKQKRLDAVAIAQPLVQGNGVRRAVAPSHTIRLAQPILPADSIDSNSLPRASEQRPLKRDPASIPPKTQSRLPPSQRPAQRPILKPWRQAEKVAKVVRSRVRKSSAGREIFARMVHAGYGDLAQLQSIVEQDVTFVSIDTESERRGLLNRVVEIGISTLAARDVFPSIEPGPHADNWISHVKHNHIVVTDTVLPNKRMRSSRFGWSSLLSGDAAKAKVLEILRSIKSHDGKRRIAFVGQSLLGDLNSLRRSPNLHLDLLSPEHTDLGIVTTFDTYMLGLLWRKNGGVVPSLRLSPLAKALDVNPKYFTEEDNLRGWHNASNDAAYTMMILLNLLAKERNFKDDNKFNSITRSALSRWKEQIVSAVKHWLGR